MRLSRAKALLGASIGLAALLMAGTIAYVAYDKRVALSYREVRLENASALLSEFIGTTITNIDTVLRQSSREIGAPDRIDTALIQRRLADVSTGVTGLASVVVLDSQGRSVAGTDPNLQDLGQRSFFRDQMASPARGLNISETRAGEDAPHGRFFASRTIAGQDERPAGLIAAALDTELFQRILSSYRPEPDIAISLFTNDFQLIARAPADPALYGRSFADASLIRDFEQAKRPVLVTFSSNLIDETPSIGVVRQVPDKPLILSITVPLDRALAEWRSHSRILLSLAGLMSAFIVFAGLAGARGLKREEEVSTLLDTMFTQTPACIAIANVNGGVIKSNDNWGALADLFAVPLPLRDDVFETLRHAVIAGGDDGLVADSERFLRDLRLATTGLKANATLELRCLHEGLDRFFTVTISRIRLAEEESSEGFAALVVDISKQRALELRLRSQLVLDSQTNLPNREGLIAALSNCLPGADDGDCLFTFDIVGLAELKEIRGFEVSDQAFSAVGAQLHQLTHIGCIAARIDGEKFCVFVPEGALAATGAEALRRLVDHLSREYHLSGHSFTVRMTVGGARVGDAGREPEKLIQAADIAHGLARRRGAASSAFFSARVQEDTDARVRLYQSLTKAISGNEFELEFQPKVSLTNGAIIGAEALVRWRHPELGLRPPSGFIPLAEESGLIVPLGEWVIGEVMRVLCEWDRSGLTRPVPISLNVSNAQFDREDVDKTFAEQLRRYDVRPDLVILELTESVFSLELSETVRKINRIRDLGLKVSLDDFGTGYSSLSYLNLMNFDELKIDGSFVRKIDTDVVSRAIVDMTLRLAHTLDVSVTAEGVETEEQRQALIALGCSTGQGYLFAKSLPVDEFRAMVENDRRLLPNLLL